MVDILYTSHDFLVLDKPAGFASERYIESYAQSLIFSFRQISAITDRNNQLTPVAAHRLDKPTTGNLIVALTSHAKIRFTELFYNRSIDKTYYALVHGRVAPEEGTIEAPLKTEAFQGRHGEYSLTQVAPDGKQAISHFRVVARGTNWTLLTLKPVTGRTHQLRVHCRYIGHPIVGDDKYGCDSLRDLFLHARGLQIPQTIDHAEAKILAPFPQHFADTIKAMRGPKLSDLGYF